VAPAPAATVRVADQTSSQPASMTTALGAAATGGSQAAIAPLSNPSEKSMPAPNLIQMAGLAGLDRGRGVNATPEI